MSPYTHDFSVLVITFNHEPFIQEALNSILQQKFRGSLQVIIGIDKSKDRTLEICKNYQEKYPNIFNLIVHETNVGMFQNFYDTLKKCTGKYISILEGDDYWVSKDKLQLQFDFFEKYPECVLSAGNIDVVDENSNLISKGNSGKGGKIMFREDLIIINRLNTLTTAFRSSALIWTEIEKLRNSPHLDWGFYISLNYENGGFIYSFNQVFGAYRKHLGGVYSLVDPEKRNLNILKSIYCIYTLKMEDIYKTYIKYLFANYSLRLKNKEILSVDPYKNFFDVSLIIYDEKNRIKRSFIRKLLKSIYFNNGRRSWKLDFELIRQTRLSKNVYLSVMLLPVLPGLFFLLWKEKRKLNNFYKMKRMA